MCQTMALPPVSPVATENTIRSASVQWKIRTGASHAATERASLETSVAIGDGISAPACFSEPADEPHRMHTVADHRATGVESLEVETEHRVACKSRDLKTLSSRPCRPPSP